MKKILSVLFTVVLMLTFVVTLYIYNFTYNENVLFTGKTSISVAGYDQTTAEIFHNEISGICENTTRFFKNMFILTIPFVRSQFQTKRWNGHFHASWS